MRDYRNLPALEWRNEPTAHHARFQIRRQQPAILKMPGNTDFTVDAEAFGCETGPGALVNCRPEVLRALAVRNHLPGMDQLAAAAECSGSRIDLDVTGKRLIVHD